MRIFYASDSTPNADFVFSSNIWRHNLYHPLVDLGHEVVEFNYDLRETFRNLDPADRKQKSFIDLNRPVLSAELVRQIKAAHARRPIDLFFSYFYSACVLAEAIEEIKSLGILTVNWYCNASYQLHLVAEIAPHYDWCLVPEKFRLDDYKALGARPIYCQEAANPNVYKRHPVPVEFDVTFVGQAYGDRPLYIKSLLEAGIDTRVWGAKWDSFSEEMRHEEPPVGLRRALHVGGKLCTRDGWKSVARRLKSPKQHVWRSKQSTAEPVLDTTLPARTLGAPLSDEELIKLFSRSRINLGFASCGETHRTGEKIVQVRLRDFEVPMSGGFYLAEYVEELEEFYEIGREIVCFAGGDELVDKARYFLAHESEREKIREAGHRRCLRDHTWHQRFRDAFKQMGLDG
jgi:spore maturation protein CgeB